MKAFHFPFFLVFVLMTNISNAQKYSADNGDGTYTNPLIPADFPDPDVIKVDSVYYMVSTTMFIFPGVTLLKSMDLVNWEYCSNAVQRMDFSPCYNLEGCNRYGHGQWATSLKYHAGKFYLMFITLDEGGFVCSATDPSGPWELRRLKKGFYDPGLFFDEDGKIYVAHGYNKIFITEVDSNFSAVAEDVNVYNGTIRPGLEGTHVYRLNGYYYLYCTYGGGDGFQVALRSRNIYGPYEEKIVIRDTIGENFGIHQGALIQANDGNWWTVLFTDEGPFGRFPSLQPVTWIDGWPMVGKEGQAVTTWQKPWTHAEVPLKTLPRDDEFSSNTLGMQWGWNHNPVDEGWSLSEYPGFLRLKTIRTTTGLPAAPNTLTQRIFAGYSKTVFSCGIVKLHTEKMKEGDVAGLAVFQDPYGYIGVRKEGGESWIVMVNNGIVVDSVKTNHEILYLKGSAAFGSGKAVFSWSGDHRVYHPLGNELNMRFRLNIFTGNKFCLFNFATRETGGYADFDWFRTEADEL